MPTTRACNIHRWYEPGTGRYTSVDPLGLGAEVRREWSTPPFRSAAALSSKRILAESSRDNEFSYGRLNPLRNTDPLGLQAVAGGVCQPYPVLVPPSPWVVVALVGVAVVGSIWDDLTCDKCPEPKEPSPCDILVEWCLEHPWQPEGNIGLFGDRKDCGACWSECKKSGGAWPFYKCPTDYRRNWDG